MKIVIRLDYSPEIGFGHCARGIALSEGFEQVGGAGFKGSFLLSGKSPSGFLPLPCLWPVKRVDTADDIRIIDECLRDDAPDVIVFDQKVTYPEAALLRWRKQTRLVFIDHVQAFRAQGDLVIFPTAHFVPGPNDSGILHGPEYVIVGSHISGLKKWHEPNSDGPVVVTTGGSDPEGVLFSLLDAVSETLPRRKVLFLVGKSFKGRERLGKVQATVAASIEFIEFDAAYFAKASAVIATFGVTVYEVLYLGLPLAVVSHSQENHGGALILASRVPSLTYLGLHTAIDRGALGRFIGGSDQVSIGGRAPLIDGRGAIRIASAVLQSC